jgi:hypothetical protein
MQKKVKLFSHKTPAQTMVEFALVLPILLMLVFGLLEVGRMAFLYSIVATASREAVRYGSATGLNNAGSIIRYDDCNGIRAAAEKVDFLGVIDPSTILIKYDSGPGTPYLSETCPPPAKLKTSDRIYVEVSADFVPIIPEIVPISFRTIRSYNNHTVLGSVKIYQPGPCPYNPNILDINPLCVAPSVTPGLPTATTPPTSTPHGHHPTATTIPPTSTSGSCNILATIPQLSNDYKSITWSVTNTGSTPAIINNIHISWSNLIEMSGNLTGVTLDTNSITLPAYSGSSVDVPGGSLTIASGSPHVFVFIFNKPLRWGAFDALVTFSTTGCASAHGNVFVYEVTHPLMHDAVDFSLIWAPIKNHTETNLAISTIVITWNQGLTKVCNNPSIDVDLTSVSIGSQTWNYGGVSNRDQCNGYTITPIS